MRKSGKSLSRRRKAAKKRILYTTFQTDNSVYFIAATEKGVCRLHWPASDKLIQYMENSTGCKLVKNAGHFKKIIQQILAYLAGELREFDCKIDFIAGTKFQRKCWSTMMKIPYGKTRTYQWLAEQAGSPGGFRAAGQASHNNPVPIIVPCHRVIGKDGKMVGYGGPSKDGQKRKRELLIMEGAIKPFEGKITKYRRHGPVSGKQRKLNEYLQ